MLSFRLRKKTNIGSYLTIEEGFAIRTRNWTQIGTQSSQNCEHPKPDPERDSTRNLKLDPKRDPKLNTTIALRTPIMQGPKTGPKMGPKI